MTSSLPRIAVVQFAPKLGEVHANIAKARKLCRGLTPRSVDLVCFPEMIFTGYMFPDAPSIAPYLEHPKTGPTASFCAELAKRLQCFVVAGFPERLDSESSTPPPPPPPLQPPALSPPPCPTSGPSTHSLIGANTALLYDASGALVHTYHKSNLFPTDRTWARPGAGFAALDLPAPLGRLGVAICNDLNVTAGEAWTSIERGPYELAGWCRKEDVRTLVLLNAWLRHEDGGMEGAEEEEEEEEEGGDGRGDEVGLGGGSRVAGAGVDGDGGDELEPNLEVLNYWALRLRPLWALDDDDVVRAKTDAMEGTRRSEVSTGNGTGDEPRDVIVVCCNRCGHERGKTFAGSSAMFAMRARSGKPRLLHVMGEREEGACVWTARARVGSRTLSS